MKESIDEYMEFYNNIRSHQTLKHLKPNQFDEKFNIKE